jgi:hypothetical protein
VDPIADLAKIPLAEDFASKIGEKPDNSMSLYHALVSFVGAPLVAANFNRSFFEIILFAATWIATCADLREEEYLNFFEALPPSQMARATVQEKLDRGWSWLRGHLPNLSFEPRVEAAINQAAELRYAVPTAAQSLGA